MLVYGDHARTVDPRELIRSIEVRWRDLEGLGAGLERHAALVAVFIQAGELLQGLADACAARAGQDDIDRPSELVARLCRLVAGEVAASWDSGFTAGELPGLALLDELRRLALPEEIEVKLAEGYAFYALYPELYLEAARTLGRDRTLQAVGIRSIGAGLSAMVAAAVDGPDPLTVRPVGHPFDRRLSLGPNLRTGLANRERFAIVDEGPGLSGGSFAAVQEALRNSGVPPQQVILFPSHGGEPGFAAGPERRAAYLAADRRVTTFDDLLLRDGGERLAGWVEDLTGPPIRPLEDISGGEWRARLFTSSGRWPAVWPQQERRKYLLTTDAGVFLLRFAGLGEVGEQRFALARDLGAAGWCNAPLGLRHGFIVEPWLVDARPMTGGEEDRAAILARLPAYLAWRGRRTPPPTYEGASIASLFRMLEANFDQAGGEGTSELVETWRPRLEELQTHVRPVAIDGRIQPWEWLRAFDGRVLKTDAVDHHLAHDLIGPQDIAWDVAAAVVEFGLDDDELAELRDAVGDGVGRPLSPSLVEFLAQAYAAFQMGRSGMAQDTSPQAEAARLEVEFRRYLGWLSARLGA